MKFNLKNRPKVTYTTSYVDITAWFEGFENELREIMEQKSDWGKNMCSPEEPQYSKVWGQYDLIKEILGE